MSLNPALRGAILAAVVGVLASVPLWAGQNVLFLVGLALIEALFALSWNLLFGYVGLANFGAAAFYAIGAYLVGAALRGGWPIPFLVDLLAAAAAGGGVALLVGVVALRRTTGINLAVLTLALAEILQILVGRSDMLGRDDGLSGIPRPVIRAGPLVLDLTSAAAYYWFLLTMCFLLASALWWLVRGPTGRALRSIRQDPVRAAFVGIDVHRYRILAFSISGAVGAAAGGLAAPWTQLVAPDTASWLHSAQPMLNTLLGGAGAFWGPAVGAFVYAGIGYGTQTLAGLSDLVAGAVLLVVVLGAPSGLAGLTTRFGRRRVTRPS